MKIKAKLKTQKQLEEIGYTRNSKSLFAPMSIDVESKERRIRENSQRIIPANIFKLLGKEIYIEPSSIREIQGVKCINISENEQGRNTFLPLVLISDKHDFEKMKQNEDEKERKLKEKENARSLFLNKKITMSAKVAGYTFEYFPNKKVFNAGCRTITEKEIKKVLTFIKKVLK